MSGALHPVLTIARYTLLEALRNRLLWVLAALALGAVGIAGFLQELALTESRELQAALLAAMLRLAAVFVVAVFVVTSMVREAQDKGQELLLAMALPRAAYLFGKLAGYAALAAPPALLSGALMLACAPAQGGAQQAALWTLSLLCELWLVAGFSLLCGITFTHALPALAAALSFYLLARMAGSLQLMAAHPARPRDASQHWFGMGVDAIAALLPKLDLYTRTEWLVYGTGGWPDLAAIAAQTAIYLALLCGAALFDLYRRAL